ncbi:GTPase IMAP family member 4 isoform X2 [Gadus morhua]|uniref:GTPase IMAP family member 4 isoform X2 n=1 Tax=Gadus morhua TaxID=8049 RepID=UPI0011B7CD53|nr:GTPase IMAP family member 4-like isoform X2 [Gadus morhua]
MDEEASQHEPELRLVLLGRAGAGQSSAGDAILGRPAFQSGEDVAASQCQRHRGRVGGRQVVVVTVPDWFSSRAPPEEEARALVSSFVALSSPGPHAFLLCVPGDQPPDGEERALAALELILGPLAVTAHTLVLFTRGEDEKEEEEEEEEVKTLEELLSTRRQDLLELVDSCGGRYHALRWAGGGGGGGSEGGEEEEEEKQRRRSVQELLKKVQRALAESEEEFFTCALYEEAGGRVRRRQEQLALERRERAGRGGIEEEEEEPGAHEAEGAEQEEREWEAAARSVVDLDVDVGGVLASLAVCPASPPPSLLWGLWERLLGWLRRVPGLVRPEALLGSLVGLFVGGPIGRMLGATAGSVATEVKRRKEKEQKTK